MIVVSQHPRRITYAVSISVSAVIMAIVVAFVTVVPEVNRCSRRNPNILSVTYEVIMVKTVVIDVIPE